MYARPQTPLPSFITKQNETMDVASVLEEYLADITTLPSEVAFILEEIRAKDARLVEIQKQIQQRDETIQKFVKNSGASAECPKEQQFYPKIRADYDECIKIQTEKARLATMGLYLVAKQVKTLDSQVEQLKATGVVFPVIEEQEEVYEVSPPPAPKSHQRKMISEGSRRASRASVSSADNRDRDRSSRDRLRERDRKAVARDKPVETENRETSQDKVKSEDKGTTTTNTPTSNPTSAAATPAPSATTNTNDTTTNPDTKSATPSIDGKPAGENTPDVKSAGAVPSPGDGRVNMDINGTRISLKRDHNSTRHMPGTEDVTETFCYCKKPSVGNMIACDSDNCDIEWFHWVCVGLTADPVGAWFCQQCRDKMKKTKTE